MKYNLDKIFLVCISDMYYKNNIFNNDSPQNRDDAYYPFYLLQKKFEERGVLLNTYDYFDRDDKNLKNCALLFFDIPTNFSEFQKKHAEMPKYLIITESELIIPRNWNLDLHKYFSKIFTWNDEFVDNKTYYKTNVSNKFPAAIPKNIEEKKKLCTLIAFNKKSNHPLELYSERREAIRWFEENHPEEFDFYGIGWDKFTFSGSRLVRALNHIPALNFIRRFLASDFKTYRGTVERKFDILKQYKFSICYENVRDISGWVTEKIFDCFFAGCVPVYWGAGNVTDHIPENCFIDRRKFSSYEELYEFMTSMDDSTYRAYLDRIEVYLKSPQAYQFSADFFADNISSHILND